MTLLPPRVQAAIGRVHANSQPALALPRTEGFEPTTEVDIFDAGPQLRAKTYSIRTIRTTSTARVRDITTPTSVEKPFHLTHAALDFHATIGALEVHPDGSVSLDRETAGTRALAPGDTVSFAPLKRARFTRSIPPPANPCGPVPPRAPPT